jgi:hypothetical protein
MNKLIDNNKANDDDDDDNFIKLNNNYLIKDLINKNNINKLILNLYNNNNNNNGNGNLCYGYYHYYYSLSINGYYETDNIYINNNNNINEDDFIKSILDNKIPNMIIDLIDNLNVCYFYYFFIYSCNH